MDAKGVDLAVNAFVLNDRYYPRPMVDLELWTLFVGQYLKTSKRIFNDDVALSEHSIENGPCQAEAAERLLLVL